MTWQTTSWTHGLPTWKPPRTTTTGRAASQSVNLVFFRPAKPTQQGAPASCARPKIWMVARLSNVFIFAQQSDLACLDKQFFVQCVFVTQHYQNQTCCQETCTTCLETKTHLFSSNVGKARLSRMLPKTSIYPVLLYWLMNRDSNIGE